MHSSTVPTPSLAPLNKSGVLSSQLKMVTFEGHEIEGTPWVTMSTGLEIEDDIDYTPSDFLRMLRVGGDALIAALQSVDCESDQLMELTGLFDRVVAITNAVIDERDMVA